MYINLDLETTSGADLKKVGVYVYAADPDFAIQLLAYSVDGGPVHQIDLTKGEEIPLTLQQLLLNPKVIKRAYNAAFERICLSQHFMGDGAFIDPEGWECTSVRSSASGLPASLDEVCKALDLPEGIAKKDGKRLIKLFSIARADPAEYPNEWNAYKAYNVNDVLAEAAIRSIIDKECVFTDQALYELDQRINDRGVRLDRAFIYHVLNLEGARRKQLEDEVKGLTFLTNPNSPLALSKWLSLRLGIEVAGASKDTLDAIETDDELVLKVLACRRELSLSSVKKFAPMQAGASEDGRIRGLFRCYGAGRTGRWSSVRVQLQNLARGGDIDIKTAKDIVRAGSLPLVALCYPEPMKLLSSLVRPSLIATPGNELVIGDFSSIEARIIAWYADEKWALEVFAGHGAIYEAAAARMYHRPVQEIIDGYEAGDYVAKDQRAKGKIATLALGYQGAVGALSKMGGEKMGLSVQEMQLIVNAWRLANPAIVRLWATVEGCVMQAITSGQIILGPKGLQFFFQPMRRILSIRLPSGRFLYYRNVRLLGNKISYDGYSSTARVWGKQETYGGKLVENIVQATARDCLSEAMLAADLEGLPIVMHVHDEIVLDAPKNGFAKDLKALMIAPPIWAAGLPLGAKVETSDYYTK